MNATSFTQHEKASVDMFRHILEKNKQVRDEFKKWKFSIKEHGKFVTELIIGEPDENSPQVSILATTLHIFITGFIAVCT